MLHRRFSRLAIASLLLLIIAVVAVVTTQYSEKEDFKKPSAFTSPSGFSFWLLEDNYLPIVSLRISFAFSGSAYDAEDKQGLATMVAALLDEGAGDFSAQAYHSELESIASDISFWVDKDYFYINLTTLEPHLARAMELLGMSLTDAHFAPDAIERIRNQLLTSLAKNEEQPSYLAGKALNKALFKNHPYGYESEGTRETLASITRDDLVNFTSQHFTRKNIFISAVGAIDEQTIANYLDTQLGGLVVKPVHPFDALPAFASQIESKHIHINVDVPQTVITFATNAPLRNDKDFYPTYLLNYIFGGGGFESRLMNEIREKQGLVYSVYSSFSTYEKAGFISGSAATESSSAPKTISALNDEISRIHNNGITPEELADTKSYLIYSFPLKMTRNTYLASFLDVMQREQLGIDFLQRRNQLVNDVTLEQVNEAARHWLDPASIVLVSAGQEPMKTKE